MGDPLQIKKLKEGAFAWELTQAQGDLFVYLCALTGHADANVLGWYSFNIPGGVKSVGGKLPNAWGLYDTHGNVWEVCLDKVYGG